MLTQERADVITEILNSDRERTEKILNLEPEAAMAEINALGNDFTVGEIKEYGEAVKAFVAQRGELNSDALEDVTGGSAAIAIALISLTFHVGVQVGKSFGW